MIRLWLDGTYDPDRSSNGPAVDEWQTYCPAFHKDK